jgi:hypothetical protein
MAAQSKMAVQSKMAGFFTFNFQIFGKNQRMKIFPCCKLIQNSIQFKNTNFFWKKLMVGENIKIVAKN